MSSFQFSISNKQVTIMDFDSFFFYRHMHNVLYPIILGFAVSLCPFYAVSIEVVIRLTVFFFFPNRGLSFRNFRKCFNG